MCSHLALAHRKAKNERRRQLLQECFLHLRGRFPYSAFTPRGKKKWKISGFPSFFSPEDEDKVGSNVALSSLHNKRGKTDCAIRSTYSKKKKEQKTLSSLSGFLRRALGSRWRWSLTNNAEPISHGGKTTKMCRTKQCAKSRNIFNVIPSALELKVGRDGIIS